MISNATLLSSRFIAIILFASLHPNYTLIVLAIHCILIYLFCNLFHNSWTKCHLIAKNVFNSFSSLFFVNFENKNTKELTIFFSFHEFIALFLIIAENSVFLILWQISSDTKTSNKLILFASHYCLFFGWFASKYLFYRQCLKKQQKFNQIIQMEYNLMIQMEYNQMIQMEKKSIFVRKPEIELNLFYRIFYRICIFFEPRIKNLLLF